MVTSTAQGIAADPINVGLVGAREQVIRAFNAAGWDKGPDGLEAARASVRSGSGGRAMRAVENGTHRSECERAAQVTRAPLCLKRAPAVP
ncbi:LssY C-terminal domain-containing protein [Ensifer adhaerens]|uniref:LssY C-terminal domain-containing protein n=1 Tax=Ensifer adhaerens TaxID=106592 RepID=UPI003D04DEA9